MKIRKMIGNEEDEKGFELVKIKNTPHCKKHGAMNSVRISDTEMIWRCYSEYGYGELKENQTVQRFHDRVCIACCIQTDAIYKK